MSNLTNSQQRIVNKLRAWKGVSVEVHVHEYGGATVFVKPERTGTVADMVKYMATLQIGKRGAVDGSIMTRDGKKILFDAKGLWKAHSYTGATCDF